MFMAEKRAGTDQLLVFRCVMLYKDLSMMHDFQRRRLHLRGWDYIETMEAYGK